MADVSRKLEEDLEIQRRNRREFGIKCCQENALILEAILPKITGFYIDEMKLATQNKISSLHSRLTHEDLKHECIESVKRACSSIDVRILHFYCREIEDTLDASFLTFSVNNQLQTNEDSQTQKLDVNKVLNFYNEKMKVVTQNRISSEELRLAHEKLKEECVQALKTEQSKIDSQLKVQFQKVDTSLEKHFELHKNNNELKEKICLLAMEKAHINYIHAMSNKLEGKIISPQEIEDLHKEALSGASLILKRDLMYNQEDIDIHTEKLTIVVKPNFEVLAEKNRRLFRVEEEIREFAKQKKLKEEAEKKEKASKEKLGILAKPNFEVLAEKNRELFRVEEETREFAKQQEALEKKEKAAKAQRDTLGKSNYNSTSIQKPASPLPETKSARLSSDTKFSGDKVLNSKTIIAVEFGMRTLKCGIIVDRSLKTIPDQWGNKEFPNTIAITNDDEILIGHEVSLESAVKVKFVCEMVNIFFTPLEKMQSQTISFRGTDVTVKKELLCGLILSRIKSDAERFLNTSVDSLVLTIPLCYRSTQKQAAKDAALIGGFSTVHLITEPTAVALAYAQHQVRFDSDKHLLVIVANNICGVILIDAAIYHCKEGKVKMVTCVGNSHHNVPNKLKKSFRNTLNTVFGDGPNDLIHSSLKECVKNQSVNEFALICKEREDKSIILGMVNELCKNSRPVTQPPAQFGVLIGATIFAKLWNGEEKVAKSHISDLLPYQIEVHRKNEHSTKTSIVFLRHDRLPITERMNSFPFECHRGYLNCNVYETGNVTKLPIADFVVPISSSTGRQSFGWVNFYVNWEGILRFSANYANLKEEEIIKYSSLNMTEESIAESASFVAFVVPNTRMEEEKRLFNDSKSELKVLAEFILCSLPQVQSEFGKDQMEKRASAAIAALDHPNITLEDVRNRISVLTKMKTKYISAP